MPEASAPPAVEPATTRVDDRLGEGTAPVETTRQDRRARPKRDGGAERVSGDDLATEQALAPSSDGEVDLGPDDQDDVAR